MKVTDCILNGENSGTCEERNSVLHRNQARSITSTHIHAFAVGDGDRRKRMNGGGKVDSEKKDET